MHSAPYCVVARTTATYMTYIIIYMCVVVAGVYTIIFFLFIIVLKLLFIITWALLRLLPRMLVKILNIFSRSSRNHSFYVKVCEPLSAGYEELFSAQTLNSLPFSFSFLACLFSVLFYRSSWDLFSTFCFVLSSHFAFLIFVVCVSTWRWYLPAFFFLRLAFLVFDPPAHQQGGCFPSPYCNKKERKKKKEKNRWEIHAKHLPLLF